MDWKGEFEKLMDLTPDSSAFLEDAIKSLIPDVSGLEEAINSITTYLREFSVERYLEKPAIKKLLSSKLFRDAVMESEIPALQDLYNSIREEVKQQQIQYYYGTVTTLLLYGLPTALITAVMGYAIFRIFYLWHEKEKAKEDKKMSRQLKRETNEANRRTALKRKSG